MHRYATFAIVVLIAWSGIYGCEEGEPRGEGFQGSVELDDGETLPDGERPVALDELNENSDEPGSPRFPLPAWETPEEKEARKNMRVPHASVSSSPPSGNVYIPAEFAKMQGVIVNIPLDDFSSSMWNYYAALVDAVSDAGAYVYILEPNSNHSNYLLTNVLKPRGVRTDRIKFIYMRNDAFWSRDYGPWHVYVDGDRAIVNNSYYPTRVSDDAVPRNLGKLWDEDVYSTGFYTEGGNFMTDGLGTCWASTGIFQSNNLSTTSAKNIYKRYLGCESVHFVAPLYREGTTHIDMFSKIVNQDTILVGYSNTGLGATTSEIVSLEDAAEFYANTPKPGGGRYNIVRIPMTFGYDSGYRVYYTHTNALVVNNAVLVPTYGRGTDGEALAIYRQAMPGYTVVGIDSNSTIPSGGAIHCTTMQVPMPEYSSCGNGVVESGEQCDFYLNGATCGDLGYPGGTLACSASCTFDPSGCGESPPEDVTVTETKSGTVKNDDYEYITVESSDGIKAVLSGTGDADLYVWNRSSGLTWSNYDCRPYLEGSNEVCELEGTGTFHVVVRGYAATSDYELAVTYTK